MEHYENRIVLRGSLLSLPAFSHENHSRKFYSFFLEVPRLSGTVDTLPVIAEEQPLGGAPRAVARRVQARVRGWTTGEVYAILPRVK